jgi:hypothetical protein
MRRTVAVFVALAAIALPALAAARTIQIANAGVVSPPSCPGNPCVVVSRTTAFQVTDGGGGTPFVISRSGRIVAWQVSLGVPVNSQIHYFDKLEGGTARASLAILENAGSLEYRLIALSPVVHLQPYFGKTADLQLSHPIRVAKGDIVALSVPTWLPALALDYPPSTFWRASRPHAQCLDVSLQTMQGILGSEAGYDCLYQKALVTYGATEKTSG